MLRLTGHLEGAEYPGVRDAQAKSRQFTGKGAPSPPAPALPQGGTLEELRARLRAARAPLGGFPEEALFSPPEALGTSLPRDWALVTAIPAEQLISVILPRGGSVSAADWYMYHHDERHSGDASVGSNLATTSLHLNLVQTRNLIGGIISVPSLVQGHAYVGTANGPNGGGCLYRIDLATGADQVLTVPSRYPDPLVKRFA